MFEKIQRLISGILGVAEGSITPDTDLEADLGANEQDLLEITLAIEDDFEIDIPSDVIFQTPQDIQDYLERIAA